MGEKEEKRMSEREFGDCKKGPGGKLFLAGNLLIYSFYCEEKSLK